MLASHGGWGLPPSGHGPAGRSVTITLCRASAQGGRRPPAAGVHCCLGVTVVCWRHPSSPLAASIRSIGATAGAQASQGSQIR
jgi:hypothetical protein